MYKVVALMLACVMAMGLSGCGAMPQSGEGTDTLGQTQSSSVAQTSPDAEETGDDDDDAVTLLDVLGETRGSLYSNEYLGISGSLGDGWQFLTDAELAQFNGWGRDELEDEDFMQQVMESQFVFYDMMSVSDDQTQQIIITIENMEVGYGQTYSPDEYVAYAVETLEQAYASMGCTDVKCEVTSVSLMGEEMPAISCYANSNGMPTYSLSVCKQTGRYMGVVAFNSLFTDTRQEILRMFGGETAALS